MSHHFVNPFFASKHFHEYSVFCYVTIIDGLKTHAWTSCSFSVKLSEMKLHSFLNQFIALFFEYNLHNIQGSRENDDHIYCYLTGEKNSVPGFFRFYSRGVICKTCHFVNRVSIRFKTFSNKQLSAACDVVILTTLVTFGKKLER